MVVPAVADVRVATAGPRNWLLSLPDQWEFAGVPDKLGADS